MPAPMRFDRHSLLGGQSDRSGRWPSRVWITVIPTARQAASTSAVGSSPARVSLRS